MNFCKAFLLFFIISNIALSTSQQSSNLIFIDELYKSIFNFQSKMQQMILSTKSNSQKRTVIFVIGDTGAGKSTFINFINGLPLKAINLRRRRDLALDNAEQDPRIPIGHQQKSKTKEPNMFLDNSNKVWVDTSGFQDTEGEKADIRNTLLLNKIFNSVQSKKIILVISEDMLLSGRSQSLKLNILKLKSTFGNSFGELGIVISKATGRCEYRQQMQYIILNDDSPLAEENREFLLNTIKNAKIVPFYAPNYNSAIPNDQNNQLFYLKLRQKALGILQTQPLVRTNKAKNIFAGESANMIKQWIEQFQKYLQGQLTLIYEYIIQGKTIYEKGDVLQLVLSIKNYQLAEADKDKSQKKKQNDADIKPVQLQIKSASDLELNSEFKQICKKAGEIFQKRGRKLQAERTSQICKRLIDQSHKFSSVFEDTYICMKDASQQKLVQIQTKSIVNKFCIKLCDKLEKKQDQKLEEAQKNLKKKIEGQNYDQVQSGFIKSISAEQKKRKNI